MNRALIGTAVLVAGAAVAAFAQASPRDGFGPGSMPGMMGGPALCADPAAEIAGKLAYAEKRLAVTDAERPAWDKLVAALNAAEPKIKVACDTMKAHRDTMKARRDANERPTAVERLDFMTTMSKSASDLLASIQPAVTDFYNQLTPDQKKIADTLILPGPGFHGGHWGPRSENKR